jgi:peptidoglycan/LPS O-acetylase OafA/YrhL
MKKGTSLYLDLVRFLAAFMVFLDHFKTHTRTSLHSLWDAHPSLVIDLFLYSQTAVIVFFVLSGYVIAHVLATRENTPLEFAASRFARLYSVAVPALLLVAITNSLAVMRYPHAFDSYGTTPAAVAASYLGSALFVSHFWLWRDLEPPNAPFWSLSFEVAYYVAIALWVFTKGRIRVLSLLALSALSGPTMVLLAPTWLLGYGTYHLSKRRNFGAGPAIAVWLASIALLLLACRLELMFRTPLSFLRMPDNDLGALVAAYAVSIVFAVNVLAFDAFADRAEAVLGPFTSLVRWLGSMTFALYLFHQPLMSFFGIFGPSGSVTAHVAVLAGGTLFLVATLGRLCEQSKGLYKRFALSLWNRALVPVVSARKSG